MNFSLALHDCSLVTTRPLASISNDTKYMLELFINWLYKIRFFAPSKSICSNVVWELLCDLFKNFFSLHVPTNSIPKNKDFWRLSSREKFSTRRKWERGCSKSSPSENSPPLFHGHMEAIKLKDLLLIVNLSLNIVVISLICSIDVNGLVNVNRVGALFEWPFACIWFVD